MEKLLLIQNGDKMIGWSNTEKYLNQQIRNNPKYKWDRTLQYRLNLIKLMTDLNAIGYQLEGYAMFKQEKKETSPKKDPINQPEKDGPKCPVEGTRCPIEKTKKEVQKGQDDGAIPEITIENTTKNTSAKQTENEKQDDKAKQIIIMQRWREDDLV